MLNDFHLSVHRYLYWQWAKFYFGREVSRWMWKQKRIMERSWVVTWKHGSFAKEPITKGILLKKCRLRYRAISKCTALSDATFILQNTDKRKAKGLEKKLTVVRSPQLLRVQFFGTREGFTMRNALRKYHIRYRAVAKCIAVSDATFIFQNTHEIKAKGLEKKLTTVR